VDKSLLKKILVLVLVWRIGLFVVSLIAPAFISYEPSFPYAYDLLAKLGLPQWLYSWANFDGVHYLTIMRMGYVGTGLIQAFFPAFPFIVKYISFGISHTVVAVGLNFVALSFAVYFLYKLVRQRISDKATWLTIGLLLLFPTSFFFGAIYSESFFLLFTTGAFLAAQKKLWPLAALATGLAISTRLVGVFILPALLLEIFLQTKKISARVLFYFLLSLTGLGLFMAFLQSEFHDPLYFFHVQSEFGSGRQETLIFLPQTVWRGLKIILTVPMSRIWLTYFQEFVLTCLAVCTIAYGFWKRIELKLPLSWLVFTLGAVLLPTLTGTLSSMPRYLLVAFPLFFIWAQILNRYKMARVLLLCLSLSLLVYNSVLFIQGYWIA